MADVRGGMITLRRPDLAEVAAEWNAVARLAADGAEGRKRRSDGRGDRSGPADVRE